MDSLATISRPIEKELQDFNSLFERTLRHDNPILRLACGQILQSRGKQMRPILVLLAARYAGTVNADVLNAAVALELLHTASLVHDDVVDESDLRRGKRSINAMFGGKVAVLVGDFLFSRALYHAAVARSAEVVEWLSKLGETLSDGELQQLSRTESTEFSEEAYYTIVEKKTSSLFSLCARMGAHLAGGSASDVLAMQEFGSLTGTCFQLRDDIFDYDASNKTGKPTGNDMKEGKLTLPLLHALLTQGTDELRQMALRVRQAEASDEEIARLVRFARESGGIDYTVSAMRGFSDRAQSLLSPAKDASILQSLRRYVEFVVQRDA